MSARLATLRDSRGICALSKEWTEDAEPLERDVIAEYIHDQAAYCIEDEGDVFGVLLLNHNADGSIHIGRLFVHPDYRDEGYGSELMACFIEDNLAQKSTAAYISINEDHPAIPFYRRFGFVETNDYKPPKKGQIAMIRPAEIPLTPTPYPSV